MSRGEKYFEGIKEASERLSEGRSSPDPASVRPTESSNSSKASPDLSEANRNGILLIFKEQTVHAEFSRDGIL